MLAESLHNDLQAAALHLRPELGDVLELGERNGALAGVVSGIRPVDRVPDRGPRLGAGLQIALSAARLTVLRVTGPAHGARVVS